MTSRRTRPVQITIPDDVTFDDLDLAYDPAADAISMDGAVLARVLEANGLEPGAILRDQQQQCRMLVNWYEAHLAAGGERDTIMDLFSTDTEFTIGDSGDGERDEA
jgi:hypothetical protein